jgi:hypothetical protein
MPEDVKPKPAPAPRRGLLTEDRNAVVRPDDNGGQKIVKVASRADEAAARGVSESSI